MSQTMLLRRALAADAIASGAFAVALLTASDFLAVLLGLSASVLFGVGIVLLAWVVWTGWLARQEHPPRTQVWWVIGLNVLIATGSLVLIMSDLVHSTAFGTALIVVQAVGVGILAELQYIGVRRIRTLA